MGLEEKGPRTYVVYIREIVERPAEDGWLIVRKKEILKSIFSGVDRGLIGGSWQGRV